MKKIAFGFLMLLISIFPLTTFAQPNPNNMESFSELKGVNVLDIMPDRFGFIWMATQNGRSRIDIGKREIKNYTASGGLPQMSIPAICWSDVQNKLLWLNDIDGFSRFDFFSNHYSAPAKTKYAYKPENQKDIWRVVGNQLSTFYSILPPGDYVFRVNAAKSNGDRNEEGVLIRPEITTPRWKTGWAYSAYVLLFLIGVRVVHVFQKQRVIRLERAKTQAKEIQQAREIEKAYETLKATQAQLIQSEKMAGLGVLTAGIAHEIQNPLNFVTNFSEVSSELVRELQEARKKEQDKRDIDLENEILMNLKENLDKISHHSKRADAIVKSMVEHSRTTSGQKELTHINSLIESSLQLAYHGYCSKEKNCSCELKTILDGTLPQVNIIPQDIGRVLLNVFNNAFYAVNEKLKADTKGYKPVVRVTSKNLTKSLKISIFDNGIGIPAGIKDKIFNPFFTTKPTGKGTGLGLSLAYDIVKAHRGEIKAESEEGKGSTFIITLPLT